MIVLQRNTHSRIGIVQPFLEQRPTSQRGSTAFNHTLRITHKGKNTEHTHSEQVQADSAGDTAQFKKPGSIPGEPSLFLTSHGADESYRQFSPPPVTAAQTARSHVSSTVHYSNPFLALKP